MSERFDRLLVGFLAFLAIVCVFAGLALALGEWGDALLLDESEFFQSLKNHDTPVE